MATTRRNRRSSVATGTVRPVAFGSCATIRDLEVLRAVVRHGSFSAAARELGISQPAVSRTREPGPVRRLDQCGSPAAGQTEAGPGVGLERIVVARRLDVVGLGGELLPSRAPLILSGPGVAAQGRIPRSSCLVDVAPTVMEWLGLPARPSGRRLDGSIGPTLLARQDGPDSAVSVVLWKSGKEAVPTFGKMALVAQGKKALPPRTIPR